MKDRILALAVIACALWPAVDVSAHDIPNDVTVQVLVKPDGQRVQLLVRAPLKANSPTCSSALRCAKRLA